jgi:hypothetical protein
MPMMIDALAVSMQYLFSFVSHGYLQLQDNNKVLEIYAKCVAVGTLRTGYPHI